MKLMNFLSGRLAATIACLMLVLVVAVGQPTSATAGAIETVADVTGSWTLTIAGGRGDFTLKATVGPDGSINVGRIGKSEGKGTPTVTVTSGRMVIFSKMTGHCYGAQDQGTATVNFDAGGAVVGGSWVGVCKDNDFELRVTRAIRSN